MNDIFQLRILRYIPDKMFHGFHHFSINLINWLKWQCLNNVNPWVNKRANIILWMGSIKQPLLLNLSILILVSVL